MLKFLDKDVYTIFKDLYIPKADGTTLQVDHVVVSKYGIFVIETKNYKGWIFGSETTRRTGYHYQTVKKYINMEDFNKLHYPPKESPSLLDCHR